MKTIVIGVMPQEQIRARTLAIARGDYKPKPGEPKIWFTSMKSVAEVLSEQNRALLKVIRETNPDSMAVLARTTGRQPGHLSRTLQTMSRYGLCGPAAREDARAPGRQGHRVSDFGGGMTLDGAVLGAWREIDSASTFPQHRHLHGLAAAHGQLVVHVVAAEFLLLDRARPHHHEPRLLRPTNGP